MFCTGSGFWSTAQPTTSAVIHTVDGGTEVNPGGGLNTSAIDRIDNRRIWERVVPVANRCRAAVGNMVRAVGALERWWWRKYEESRPMEEMPAEDLDNYLTEYFSTLRRPDGSDYEQASLKNFRSLLDRFLRDHKYPYSLCKSSVFARSQRALWLRRKHLSAKGTPG